MTCDHGDTRLQRREHRGLLAHRTVLAGERPDDHGVGARGGEPLAARAPRHRPDTAGIAAHPHVPVIGKPPAVQRRLMHGGDEEFVVGAEGDGEMRAGPFQKFRLRRHVGKPQRHAVVMGDRYAQSLGRERKPADGRGRIETFFLALAAADERGLAGRPGRGAIGMQRDVIDPAPFCVGRQHRDLALGVKRDDLAIVAAGDDALAVRRRTQNGAAMDGDLRDFARPVHHRRVLLGADKHRGIAEEIDRADGHADRQRPHLVGEGSDGGHFARIELFHHVTIQLSKPSRIICSGNSRPMKTTRLSRGSPSFHFR